MSYVLLGKFSISTIHMEEAGTRAAQDRPYLLLSSPLCGSVSYDVKRHGLDLMLQITEHLNECLYHARIKLTASALAKFRLSLGCRQGFSIGAIRGHGIIGVHYRQNARAQG